MHSCLNMYVTCHGKVYSFLSGLNTQASCILIAFATFSKQTRAWYACRVYYEVITLLFFFPHFPLMISASENMNTEHKAEKENNRIKKLITLRDDSKILLN